MSATQLEHEAMALVLWLNEHRTPSPERQEALAALDLVKATLAQRQLAPLSGRGPMAAGSSVVAGFLFGLDRSVDETMAIQSTKEQLSTATGVLEFYVGLQKGGALGALRSLKDNLVGLAILGVALAVAGVATALGPALGPILLAGIRMMNPELYEKIMNSAAKIGDELKNLLVKIMTDPAFISNSGFNLGLAAGIETGNSVSKEYLAGSAGEKGEYVGNVLGYAATEIVLLFVAPETLALKAGSGAGKAMLMATKLSARTRAIAKMAPEFVELLARKGAAIGKMLDEFSEALRRAIPGPDFAAEHVGSMSARDFMGEAASEGPKVVKSVRQQGVVDALAESRAAKTPGASGPKSSKLIPKKVHAKRVGIDEKVRAAEGSKLEGSSVSAKGEGGAVRKSAAEPKSDAKATANAKASRTEEAALTRVIDDSSVGRKGGIRPLRGTRVGGGVVAKHHNANVRIVDEMGRTIHYERKFSGGMTPKQKEAGWKGQLEVHTEPKGISTAPKPPAGGKRIITGQEPPCAGCRGFMNRSTAEDGIPWVYRWRQGGRTHKWESGVKRGDVRHWEMKEVGERKRSPAKWVPAGPIRRTTLARGEPRWWRHGAAPLPPKTSAGKVPSGPKQADYGKRASKLPQLEEG